MLFSEMDKTQLNKLHEELKNEYENIKDLGLKLNMSRGVPSVEQLNLSQKMFDVLNSDSDCNSENGTECRNYGVLDGIPECKKLMADMMGVEPSMVMVGGNSSLNMMFDTIACFMTTPVCEGAKPWYEVKDRKFLCPVPGYDRHFGVTEYFGFQMIQIPMTDDGPDMDMVEELIKDESVKGMWCVPKYSNPQGITYSDETVKRIANLKPAAKDFRIMWDNAYCIHDLTDTPDKLLNIFDEIKNTDNEDLVIGFCSTSKISLPGSGVAALFTFENNMKVLKNKYKFQTIGYDKLNMLRHVRFFKDIDGMKAHMQKHKEILQPRFEMVVSKLKENLDGLGVIEYRVPNGGYFVSVNVMKNTAKRVVELCKEAGVTLTNAGATYPYGDDPNNSNIRIAPTFPSLEDLSKAMDVFCICTKLAATEELLK
ncbi:MAG: aminotransferase class I/II-fold pyridoxal phosphate-dependent enzyme [Oscillospiraceae bacterium]|nr:aminotransferase class I/II-fold pyridoxal phosphate-dependent enzyme [Candidatus Ruminococcus equi]